jgi:hypothetical protein
MAKERLKLRDQETTFHDPETRLKIVRDQVVEIDPKARKGKLTLAAIKAGGLIEVKTESKAAAEQTGSKDKDKEKAK